MKNHRMEVAIPIFLFSGCLKFDGSFAKFSKNKLHKCAGDAGQFSRSHDTDIGYQGGINGN
jgi:hypothetical protein